MSLKRCQRYAQVVVDGSGQSVVSTIMLTIGNGHYNAGNKIVFDHGIYVYESKYTTVSVAQALIIGQ